MILRSWLGKVSPSDGPWQGPVSHLNSAQCAFMLMLLPLAFHRRTAWPAAEQTPRRIGTWRPTRSAIAAAWLTGLRGNPLVEAPLRLTRWPVDQNRREVIMFTDGVGRDRHHYGWHRGYRTDVDVNTAIASRTQPARSIRKTRSDRHGANWTRKSRLFPIPG